uniref:DM5 domain-containing protein n=1 Tax=Caenorhabditis tropicalis TaxID=1561998 RepID=A0A1I7TND8_9PELO
MSDSDDEQPLVGELGGERQVRVVDNQQQHQAPQEIDDLPPQPVYRRNRAYRRQVVPVSELNGVIEYRYMLVRADRRDRRNQPIRRPNAPVSPPSPPDSPNQHPNDPCQNQEIHHQIIRPIPLRLGDDNGIEAFLYQHAFIERGLPLHPPPQPEILRHPRLPFDSPPDFLFLPPFVANIGQLPQHPVDRIFNGIPLVPRPLPIHGQMRAAEPLNENSDSDTDTPQDPHP